jgi:hypothetical protein
VNEVNRTEENPKFVAMANADLELTYIDEYLRKKGCSIRELDALPEKDGARLRTEASQYVSLKLAKLESRARLRTKIRNGNDTS